MGLAGIFVHSKSTYNLLCKRLVLAFSTDLDMLRSDRGPTKYQTLVWASRSIDLPLSMFPFRDAVSQRYRQWKPLGDDRSEYWYLCKIRSRNHGSGDGIMEMSSLIYPCQTQGSGFVNFAVLFLAAIEGGIRT